MPITKTPQSTQIASGGDGLGKLSTLNSSTAALNAAAVFTGAWEDVSDYNSVVIAVTTDQNGSYAVQFSPDGTNIDSSLTRYYNTAKINAPHRFTITRQYFRVVFTNSSASNQTYFRLQTAFGDKGELNAPLDSTLSQDYDATATRPTDYRVEAAQGIRQGVEVWNKFGYNADIDIGTEVLASFGGTFTPLTTATTLTIVSSSTDDDGDPAGTGLNSIVVYGIDSNRDAVIEVVTLNGTTNVVTASTWLGINRVAMYLCGSGKTNAGTITLTATTGGSTMAQMPAGEGVTQQCIFHIPRNTQFIAEWLRVNTLKQSGANPVVTIKGWVYSALNNGTQEIYRASIDTAVDNNLNEAAPLPFPIGGSSVFWLEATTDKADTIVTARFSGLLTQNVGA